jgi:hypothetical protein
VFLSRDRRPLRPPVGEVLLQYAASVCGSSEVQAMSSISVRCFLQLA